MSSAPSVGGGQARALAAEAHALVQDSPRRARALAERALLAAARAGDVEAEVAARYALAWALGVLGDRDAARKTLRTGIRLAERSGDRRGAGLLRRNLATQLADSGQTKAANREMTAALSVLAGRDRAEAQVHRLEVYRRSQDADPQVARRVAADVDDALELLRREGDELWQARLLFNRGLFQVDRGQLELAEPDLRAARALYSRVGADGAAANAGVMLAAVALLRGELVTCLKALDELARTPGADYARWNYEECKVKALAQARLLPEAREAARSFVELCNETGRRDWIPAALLDLAAIALMSGDATAAHDHALHAARSSAARGKRIDAALARTMRLRALLAANTATRASVHAALEAAALLETAGWTRDALRARILAARIDLAIGGSAVARRELVRAKKLRAHGTANDLIELLHAEALLSISEVNRPAAIRKLERGLSLLDQYRAALGAIELRAAASAIGSELAESGLRLALESRRPATVLSWAERLRANALRLPVVRPAADATLRRLQVELRQAVGKGATTQQARLEGAIRTRSRLVEPDGGSEAAIPDLRTAARGLGDRALVEYVELDGSLHALTLRDGRLELHGLRAELAKDELEWLRFALGQLARADVKGQRRAAARDSAAAAGGALDRLLVEPLLPAVGSAELVLVPTGPLHALPWAALPSLRGRPLAVAPSLAIWASRAVQERSRARKAMLAAGPRLRHAEAEVRGLAGLLPKAKLLSGGDATAAAVLEAIDGAALAHLACHGHFRSDSPLFSSLELADGPLNVYELQRLRRPPGVVVLSACDLGLSALHPGDELLGLATALLGMGTRTVVASVAPIADATSRRLMLAFHRSMHAGDGPAAALARAQARTQAASFVCLGSG